MPASRPYSGETIDDLLRAHRRDPIPSLPGVGPLFARLVAKKPADRFANLAEVLAGIDALKRSPTRRAVMFAIGGVALAGYVLWPRGEPTPTRLPFDGRAEQQRWASILKRPIEMTNDLDMKLMLIPPGESGHGAFYLGATEVTIGQFRRFVESSRPRYITQAEQDTG